MNINWTQLGKLIAMILAIQAIYWFGIDQNLFRANPGEAPPMVKIGSAEIARLKTPTLKEAETAAYKPVELQPAGTMWTHCCDTAMFAVRIPFEVDKIPANGLGLISDLQVDNYILTVNGSTLVARGTMQPGKGSFHGQIKYLTRIPAGLLKQGRNELTYITLRDGFPYTDIVAPRIADYDALDRHSAKRLYIVGNYLMVAGLLMGLLGLLAAIMIFRSDDWRFALWLSALCAAFASYSAYSLWLDPPVDGWGRMVAFFAIYMFIPTALVCFIDSWTQKPLRWLQRTALVIYAAALSVIAWYIYRVPMPAGFDTPAIIWVWFLMGSAIAVVARLIWHFATQAEDRLLESALLTVFAFALILDAMANWFPSLGLREGNLLNSSLFLVVAMMAAFLARNFRLFQSQGALTALLKSKIDQREAELLEAAMREQMLVRQQAHDEERRRIMRDLHDGLGSQLMSMMLSARLGEADPPKVAEGLQAVIDEMRLMVDSMDSVGESLEAALATFRARVEPRVKQTGFGFTWAQADNIELPHFGPRDGLQVFRVLQEAVTNALKHSGGSTIAIAIETTDQANIQISVSDNGKGGAEQGEAGRGLTNMQNRIRAVAGECRIISKAGKGTQIILKLPKAAPKVTQAVA